MTRIVCGWEEGRLTRAALHPYVKHPAILPKGHHVSRLLITHFLERICHQGCGMTMNEIRSNGFWILGCSSEVSSIIYKCVKCRKYRKCIQEQVMADLPSERLEPTPSIQWNGLFRAILCEGWKKGIEAIWPSVHLHVF